MRSRVTTPPNLPSSSMTATDVSDVMMISIAVRRVLVAATWAAGTERGRSAEAAAARRRRGRPGHPAEEDAVGGEAEPVRAVGGHRRPGVVGGGGGRRRPPGPAAKGRSATVARVRRRMLRSPPTKRSTNSLAGARRRSSGEAYCSRTPPTLSRAMRSASLMASSRSWVTSTIVLWTRDWRPSSSSCRRPRTTGSTAPKGSSMRRTGGSAARARATPTRCCWPPESSSG